ncbi:MAG: hypothetical protein NC180_04075 [Muribaculaceae bacterium]|nr:hypothetical protein [Roseburia sp.]MCM1430420.1 hypothetical protein [Muribaculaceae bacterium]MCM1492384.1 hypothetical protein [Muribaculaceae bacterium]
MAELSIEEPARRSWEDIPEALPDEIDLQMLKEMDEDPECNEFISEKEM